MIRCRASVVLRFLYVLLFQSVICQLRIDPLVNTDLGLMRGLRANNGDYSIFLGIPYAKVDDKNPFGDAIPHPPFEDTFEAYDGSVICPQIHEEAVGTLDCLHLNVYVPATATSANRLPVMVYIHGGAFIVNDSEKQKLSPRFLVQQDVIVVTLNYRLGVYGFICLDIPEAPGNQGLKDQYIALKWIKNNIESFGGDAKITLFGQSAGGHSIDLHLISSKDILYNKVILISGSAEAATVLYEPDKAAAEKIAHLLGFEGNDTNEALQYLATIDTNLVIDAAAELNIIFKPCVEGKFNDVEPFFTNHWINAEVPKVRNMPVMIGFTEHEMAPAHLFKPPTYYENLSLVSDYLNRTFDFDKETYEEMKNLILYYYFGDKEMSESVKWKIISFDTDFTYAHPVQRTINKYLESNAGNIYYYMFSYVGGRNKITIANENAASCCASHADDLSYTFDSEIKPQLTEADQVIMERMTTMWTNFAKYSDPTPETSELLPVKWLPATKKKYNYMNIGTELTIKRRPHYRRMAFWNLFYKYSKHSQKWYSGN